MVQVLGAGRRSWSLFSSVRIYNAIEVQCAIVQKRLRFASVLWEVSMLFKVGKDERTSFLKFCELPIFVKIFLKKCLRSQGPHFCPNFGFKGLRGVGISDETNFRVILGEIQG